MHLRWWIGAAWRRFVVVSAGGGLRGLVGLWVGLWVRAGGEGVEDVGADGVGRGWVGWKWMFIEFEEGLLKCIMDRDW